MHTMKAIRVPEEDILRKVSNGDASPSEYVDLIENHHGVAICLSYRWKRRDLYATHVDGDYYITYIHSCARNISEDGAGRYWLINEIKDADDVDAMELIKVPFGEVYDILQYVGPSSP